MLDDRGDDAGDDRKRRGKNVMTDETKGRLILDYPCPWVYKVIGADGEQLRLAIGEVLGGREHLVTPSRTSRSGKYQSLDIEVVVRDEAERNAFYVAFKRHAAVVMVL